MSRTILMLATYGLEIIEVGGTLALHAEAGDEVHAAVVLAKPDYREQITAAAKVVGVQSVTFLEFNTGEIQVDVPSKKKLVKLFRRIKPDTLITQDPEHSYHDLDPDRRLAMLLYLEAAALGGRAWHDDELGKPHAVRNIYYMTPDHPNCVVEISSTFDKKQEALQMLDYQLAFTAQTYRERMDEKLLTLLVGQSSDNIDNLELGRALHREMDKALALSQGLLSHSGAVMAEAFRHEDVFKLTRLL